MVFSAGRSFLCVGDFIAASQGHTWIPGSAQALSSMWLRLNRHKVWHWCTIAAAKISSLVNFRLCFKGGSPLPPATTGPPNNKLKGNITLARGEMSNNRACSAAMKGYCRCEIWCTGIWRGHEVSHQGLSFFPLRGKIRHLLQGR